MLEEHAVRGFVYLLPARSGAADEFLQKIGGIDPEGRHALLQRGDFSWRGEVHGMREFIRNDLRDWFFIKYQLRDDAK
jgi:hypothetical protein